MAVICHKYRDRPLIGRVASYDDHRKDVLLDWYMGTYSGSWRWWKGKKDGQMFVYTDKIPVEDIVMRHIPFSKSMQQLFHRVLMLDSMFFTTISLFQLQQSISSLKEAYAEIM